MLNVERDSLLGAWRELHYGNVIPLRGGVYVVHLIRQERVWSMLALLPFEPFSLRLVRTLTLCLPHYQLLVLSGQCYLHRIWKEIEPQVLCEISSLVSAIQERVWSY